MPDGDKRIRKASAKVTNPDNNGDLQLTSHKKAREGARRVTSGNQPTPPDSLQSSTSETVNASTKRTTPIEIDSDPDSVRKGIFV